jgi:hypothetical protein
MLVCNNKLQSSYMNFACITIQKLFQFCKFFVKGIFSIFLVLELTFKILNIKDNVGTQEFEFWYDMLVGWGMASYMSTIRLIALHNKLSRWITWVTGTYRNNFNAARKK